MAAFAVAFTLGACKSPETKLQDAKVKATRNISESQQHVEDVRERERQKISEAKGAAKLGDAKVEATENIADAKKVVEDKKVEATKEVVNAEKKVKSDPSPSIP